MSARILASTIRRILLQLRHDHRTIGIMLVVPSLLLALLAALFDAQPAFFDRVGIIMLGIIPTLMMFLITSIVMLRERQSGTLERLFTTPLGKLDLLFGYGIAFGIMAALQGTITSAVGYWLLGLDVTGSVALVILIAVASAVLGVALGLFCSAFARTEFQAVQFMPIVVLPQILLCGLFVPRETMQGWLEAISAVLPLTYAVEALQEVSANADPTTTLWRDLAIIAGAAVVALILAAATLRRRTP
jgi:ABC-2 type transport system permease protein